MTRTIAPHPALPRYYTTESGRQHFVRRMFNETACDYDRVERVMAMGGGSWYRRAALRRGGLSAGMRVLDVAAGTGLVTREEIEITGATGSVIALDPSAGMLAESRRRLLVPARTTQGVAEALPLADQQFDFVSMGYALRHMSDLAVTFREFFRVLKPGGRVCILEITPPQSRIGRTAMKAYMRLIVPAATRLFASRRADTRLLWQYYWDTIEACVPAGIVVDALRDAGFVEVVHFVEVGLFSEFRGQRPI